METTNLTNLFGLSELPHGSYEFGGKAFSTQELWIKIAEKINILIEHFNYLDKNVTAKDKATQLKLEYLLGEGLNESVSKELLKRVEDGTLGKLINGTLLGDINKKVDDTKKELDIQMNNIVQKAMTHINASDYLKFDGSNEYLSLKDLFSLSNCIIDFPKGLTVCTDTPLVVKGVNVTINGNGSSVKLVDNSNILRRIADDTIPNYSGVTSLLTCGNNNQYINNLTINGNMRNNAFTDSLNRKWYTSFPNGDGYQCIELNSEHGIGLNGLNICSDNITIENVEVYDCSWAGIATTLHDVNFNNYLSAKWKNINILNCKIHQCVEDGISVVNAKNVIVDRCHVINSYHHGIHAYTNYYNVEIKNNLVEISNPNDDIKITPSFNTNIVRQGILVSRELMKGYTQKKVLIENNTIINKTSKTHDTSASFGSSSIGLWVVEFGYTEDYIVRDNYIYGFKFGIRFSCYDLGKNSINNNTIHECSYPIVAVYGNNGFFNGLQNGVVSLSSTLEFYNNKVINDNTPENAFKWVNYTNTDFPLAFKLIIKDFAYTNAATPIFKTDKVGITVAHINNKNSKVIFTGNFENTATSDSVVIRQDNIVTYNIKCKNKEGINASGNQELCYCASPVNDTCFPLMYINPDSSMGVVQARIVNGKITYNAPSGTMVSSGEVIIIGNVTYETV